MTTTESIDVDNIWRALGPWGRYQLKQLFSYLLICVSWCIHTLAIVFIGYRPNYKCKGASNETLFNSTEQWREYGQCSIKTYTNSSDGATFTETSCDNGWDYDIPVEQSFVTQWDLVCDTEELAELTQALMTIGQMMGALIFPSLSDKLGRKVIMVSSQIAMFAIVLGTSFCESYTSFIVLRILTGAVQQGGLAGTTLAIETFPAEIRAFTEPIALIVWTSAICVMSPIAYGLRNYSWRYLQLTFALTSAWCIFQWWMLDESLRWLIANGKLDKARQVIKNACRWNKKDYATVIKAGGFFDEELTKVSGESDDTNKSPADIEKKPQDDPDADELCGEIDVNEEKEKFVAKAPELPTVVVKKYTAIDLIRHRRVFQVSVILWFTWLTDSLAYYGLYLISSDLYGDRYINFFLSAVCEYPACAFEMWALNRFGRPLTCIMCHLTAGVSLILATVFSTLAAGNTSMMAAATAFTIIGKMGATASFSMSFVMTPEIYPTNLRNAGLGVAAFSGRVGGVIAPFFRNLALRVVWAPGLIFAIFLFAVCGGMFFVPETKGVELPETLEELSLFYSKNTLTPRKIVRIIRNRKELDKIRNTPEHGTERRGSRLRI